MSDHILHPFRGFDLDALFALDLPELEWLVDGILPAESFGMLSAREKAGKGLLAIDLLACIATETPFLGRAVKQCPVAYFPAEEHLRDVRDRVRSWFGDERKVPFYVFPLNTLLEKDGEVERLKLEDPVALQRLADTIEAYGLKLCVIDTLRQIHDGPENDADFMNPLLRPVREMSHDLGSGILLSHHHNRGNTFRGSTAIKAALDFEWSFVRTDSEDDTGPPVGRLVVEGRWPRAALHLRFGEHGRWDLATAPTLVEDTTIRGHVLAILAKVNDWKTSGQLGDAMAPQRSHTSVQNALAQMRKEVPAPFAFQLLEGRGRAYEYHCLNPAFDLGDNNSHYSHGDSYEQYEQLENVPSSQREGFHNVYSSPIPLKGMMGIGVNVTSSNDDNVSQNGEAGAPYTCMECGVELPPGRKLYCADHQPAA